MEYQVNIIGVLLMVLGILHSLFPRYFNWKSELENLSLINRQMMYVHTFFIAFVVFFMGLLCIESAKELIHTSLGRKVSLGFSLFWFARFLTQFWGYSSKLWKGKPLETSIHILLSLFWAYLTFIFFLVYLS
tara:strand:+ start:8130 stop:8525 length:396 start_codon:yes stop_codon:yes gene_type:complete